MDLYVLFGQRKEEDGTTYPPEAIAVVDQYVDHNTEEYKQMILGEILRLGHKCGEGEYEYENAVWLKVSLGTVEANIRDILKQNFSEIRGHLETPVTAPDIRHSIITVTPGTRQGPIAKDDEW